MDGFDKLELHTETLRELTQDELAVVAGGSSPTWTPLTVAIIGYTLQIRPSGQTWFMDCETRACA